MSKIVNLNEYIIGGNNPCYIIAEAGVNHNGQTDIALDMVREAKRVGAHCVKFQTFKAESVVTENAPKAKYQLKVTDNQESQFEMLKKLELSEDGYGAIIALCKELGTQFLSTPYNEDDADFLNKLDVDGFKIASGQIVEHSFLKYVAELGKPMIISSGMANLSEVYDAINVIRSTGNEDIVLLQCTTNYPSKLQDANIRAMVSMQQAMDVVIGYSDHVPNNYACYSAVALGAKVIEKHFTLDKGMEGPDHSSSLDPKEFAELVLGIKSIEASLGSSIKQPSEAEISNTVSMRRSIVLSKSLPKGTVLKKEHLTFKRPATGIAPKEIMKVLGKKLSIDLSANMILQEKHLEF